MKIIVDNTQEQKEIDRTRQVLNEQTEGYNNDLYIKSQQVKMSHLNRMLQNNWTIWENGIEYDYQAMCKKIEENVRAYVIKTYPLLYEVNTTN